MSSVSRIMLGAADSGVVSQLGGMSNRHGIIAGATGTGKTVTLQRLAEGFSELGVPVFAADVKGDLSGLAAAGSPHPKIDARVEEINATDFTLSACPTVVWDIFAQTGHPVRTTISEVGPLLLGNLLELNDTQSGVLYACFRIADDNGWLLLDLKDLRAMLGWVADNASELSGDYGNLSKQSIAAIQRDLLVLEEQGADRFFGEPALAIGDLMASDFSGHGVVSVLDATTLVNRAPRLYATFLLWLLSELYETLPETGDADCPKLVLFFDEAHLLFDQAPRALTDKIEQVVRLIRSKGVGVYFVTQNPADIPEEILGQLGMRIQHALRAFTASDRKAVKAVADNFRPNPAFDTGDVVTRLGIGEALVSVLDERGSPTPVAWTKIRPPGCRIGPIDESTRRERIERSPYGGRYEQAVDRESAYEILKRRAAESTSTETPETPAPVTADNRGSSRPRERQGIGEAMLKSAVRAVGSQLGRQIVRGLLGSLLGRRR